VKKNSKSGPKLRQKWFTPLKRRPHAKAVAEKTRCYARSLVSLNQKDGSDWPPQSGILTPGLMLRSMSMMPHLSSHSLPFSLYRTFHGSSNAENLFLD
jgi:hypothetical protein